MDFINRSALHKTISSFKLYVELMDITIEKKAKECGLSTGEARILIALSDNSQIDTASQIAKLGCISKAYISRGVEALINKNLLTTVKDKRDGRIQHLVLQPEAQKYIKPLTDSGIELINKLLNGTTEAERKSTAKLFDRLTENAVKIRNKFNEEKRSNQ